MNIRNIKETNDESEFSPLPKLTGEIIYTLGNCSCSEGTVVMDTLKSSRLQLITHLSPLADLRAVQPHWLSSL